MYISDKRNYYSSSLRHYEVCMTLDWIENKSDLMVTMLFRLYCVVVYSAAQRNVPETIFD